LYWRILSVISHVSAERRTLTAAPRFDQIGYWSEVKLDIVKDYAKAYSTILSSQWNPALQHVYIDGFSGAGVHVSRATGEFVPGSPLNALNVSPPFKEYFLIDLDGDKVARLKRLVGSRPDVHVLQGDCNEVLLKEVYPKVRFESYRRGLCLLDPYGLHLHWKVIEAAGRLRTLELFLNFPIMDMNRNALWRNPSGVTPEDAERMTAFWGDESWRSVAYRPSSNLDLFGDRTEEKVGNEEIAEAFRKRLRNTAGFDHVPKPVAMRNSAGAVVYYLFFASQKPVASKIVQNIFRKYENRN
jgi:three-Cys-motif partner protein